MIALKSRSHTDKSVAKTVNSAYFFYRKGKIICITLPKLEDEFIFRPYLKERS
jgi:hypothetical protein